RHFADSAAAHRAGRGRRPVRGVRSEEGKSGLKAASAVAGDSAPGVRASWLPKRFQAVIRIIQGDGVLVSTIA
ncbi:MAG TPA: hypothetical protein VEV86_12885, partial [Vicinamibacterales bacterium]|nr:hypothetical protein [Vicinamibacterales bacterium]